MWLRTEGCLGLLDGVAGESRLGWGGGSGCRWRRSRVGLELSVMIHI